MRSRYFAISLLAVGAILSAQSAFASFVITPTFDSSITSDVNAAQIMSTINSVITLYQSKFSDNITVKIEFVKMTSGLGASSTWIDDWGYSTYHASLIADASSANDAIALAGLPGGANEPVRGGTGTILTKADARAVGLPAGYGSDGFDGTIGLNTGICDLDRSNGVSPGLYDLYAVTAHEIDEVMGLGSWVGNQTNIRAEDLFRYDNAGARSFTSSGSARSFFSINGTSLLAEFNQNAGGDYGDWKTGAAPPQVQDAFGTTGQVINPGVNEYTALDVIGYNLAVVPEPTTIAVMGLGVIALLRRRRRA